ncbi:MAG: right-handed parallel beta-helix repeat-containing protein [Myxococcota bacterium]
MFTKTSRTPLLALRLVACGSDMETPVDGAADLPGASDAGVLDMNAPETGSSRRDMRTFDMSAQADAGARVDAGAVDAMDVGADAGMRDLRGQPDWPLQVLGTLRPRTFPGIPYAAKLGVVGGLWPYRYALDDASVARGMRIDEDGTLRWPEPSAGTETVRTLITDERGNRIEHVHELRVEVANVLFVSSEGSDENVGSADRPLRTLQAALIASNADTLIYLRSGRYAVRDRLDLDAAHASHLLGHPSDPPHSAVIDFESEGRFNLGGRSTHARGIEGLTLANGRNYGVLASSAHNVSIHSNRFDGLSMDENAGNHSFLYFPGHGTADARHALVRIQDNVFTGFRCDARCGSNKGASTWFDVHESLFERNTLTDFEGGIGFTDKDNSFHNTCRSNTFDGTPMMVLGQAGAVELNIHDNLVENAEFRICASTSDRCRDVFVHHNTVRSRDPAVTFITGFGGTTERLQIYFNIFDTEASAYRARCGALPALLDKLDANANLITTDSDLLLSNACPMDGQFNRMDWQGLGFDIDSAFEPVSTDARGVPLGAFRGTHGRRPR